MLKVLKAWKGIISLQLLNCKYSDVFCRSSYNLTQFNIWFLQVQEVALRARPDIVVATPGRMLDHLQNSLSVGLEDLSILVLDEADRLLELGFTQEVHELVRNQNAADFRNLFR